MNNSYSISNDGTIFEIKEDGSIVKLAKIDSDGHIHALSGKIISEKWQKRQESLSYYNIDNRDNCSKYLICDNQG